MPHLKRTILITGASSGIGRAIARQLLNEGHFVIGISRNCQQFVTAHPQFQSFAMDLSQLNQLPQSCQQLEKRYPELDTLIFAAGYGQFGSLETFSASQIQNLMNVNFTSIALMTRALLPKLKQKQRGDILLIGSEAALKGSRKGTIYCASKFALRGFSQALREECASSGIRVALINPGMVNTEFFAELDFAPGELRNQHLIAEDIAQAASFILNSPPHCVIDELNLNPLHKVVRFKK